MNRGPAHSPSTTGLPVECRSLSFVLPAFNEAENIGESVRTCCSVAEKLGLDYEVVVVDDGSHDETRVIVDALTQSNDKIRAIHHMQNQGYGAALRSGLFAATKKKVFFTDADLQFDVSELESLLHLSSQYDIVAGYRSPRRDPWPRRMNGWLWSRLVGLVFGLPIKDVDCAFKVFDRRVFERVPVQSIGAFINTEILVRSRAEGFSLVQVPVSHYPRRAGQQSGANLRVILRAFRELLALHRELKGLGKSSPALGWDEGPKTDA